MKVIILGRKYGQRGLHAYTPDQETEEMQRRMLSGAVATLIVATLFMASGVRAQEAESAEEGAPANPSPATPSAFEAPRIQDSARAVLFFSVSGGGETDFDYDAAGVSGFSVDNNASVGAGVRLEFPVMGGLAVGVEVDLLGYKLQGSDRDLSGHFDLWVKTRHLRAISSTLTQETYLGIPVGLSIVTFPENPALRRGQNALGWNIGVMVGGQFMVNGRYGTMLEMGWRRVETYNEDLVAGSKFSAISNQFVFNVGYVALF